MSKAQKFDFQQADALKAEMQTGMDSVKDQLKQMQTQKVEKVREWWSGGSEEAFISNFEKTRKSIDKSLDSCMSEYKKLINDIKRVKDESDKQLAQQLKN